MTILKGFYLLAQNVWINSNLDPNNCWCEYFGLIIFFLSSSQWCPMPMDLNPMSKLWGKKSFNVLLCVWCFKVHECGKISCGAKYGIWKTWKNFLDLDVHEDHIENSVEHLDLMVCMFAQPFYIVDTFFYDDVIITWINEKRKGLLNWCNMALMARWSKQPLVSMMLTNLNFGYTFLHFWVQFDFFNIPKLICGLKVRIMCYC